MAEPHTGARLRDETDRSVRVTMLTAYKRLLRGLVTLSCILAVGLCVQVAVLSSGEGFGDREMEMWLGFGGLLLMLSAVVWRVPTQLKWRRRQGVVVKALVWPYWLSAVLMVAWVPWLAGELRANAHDARAVVGLVVVPLLILVILRYAVSMKRTLVLEPGGVWVADRRGRRHLHVWDTLQVELVRRFQLAQIVMFGPSGPRPEAQSTYPVVLTSSLSLWQLTFVVDHFREHPDRRWVLGTAESVEYIRQLVDWPYDRELLPDPKWFVPPPPRDWDPLPPSPDTPRAAT